MKYKREGIPCFDYRTIQSLIRSVVSQTLQEEMYDLGKELTAIIQGQQ